MDDFSSESERAEFSSEGAKAKARALKLLIDYEQSVVVKLAEEIVRYEEDFKDPADPLHGSVPAILEKYYGVLNSVFVAKRSLRGKC